MFKITKAQILHVLAGLVFVPLSGFVTAWVSQHFPGIQLSGGQVEGAFVTGASSALGLAIHYLHGWQLWERTIAPVIDVTDTKKP